MLIYTCLQVVANGLNITSCTCPAFDSDHRGCKHMFLVPLIHSEYSARISPTTFNDTPIPYIRGGSQPQPSDSRASSSRQAQVRNDPSPAELLARKKSKLASLLLSLNRQVTAASFSSNNIEQFDDWIEQAEELQKDIHDHSFASPSARFRKQ